MEGSNWMKLQKKELSPFGERVADLLWMLYLGIYHIQGEVMRADFSQPRRVVVTVNDGNGSFSTYDSDLLTRLVFLAHEMNIRAGVRAATHGYLQLEFMQVDRNGFFADRHPTLMESLQSNGYDDNAEPLRKG